MTEIPVEGALKPRHIVPGTDGPEVQAAPASPDFASDEAAELWHERGQPELGEASGKTGYTVADVRAAAEED